MGKKTVIIGGVAGGATTAARLRRRNEEMEIVVLEKGSYISYANCGLPYYIGEVIKSRDALLLQTPQAMKDKFNIDVRTLNEAVAIFPDKKEISIKDLKTGQIYEESYDKLVIATGSSPLQPDLPGIENENIFTLWTVPHMDRIKKHINEKKPQNAAVIGGGFIGLEMAENLHQAGIHVNIIEMQNQVMAPLDFEMARLVQENLEENGVSLLLGEGVQSFEKDGEKVQIHLSGGGSLSVDMILLSVGVKPDSQLAQAAGIAVNPKGGIIVDRFLRTSVKDIYAVGDVIEVEDSMTGQKTMVPLAGPANKQARICADNIAGDQKQYKGTMGTSIVKIFDLTAGCTGSNEKRLQAEGKEKGKDYFSALINQKSHAGYYPGAVPITLKMIFDKNGKILGMQAAGQDGVDKRIDIIASVMRTGGTIYDLEELELAYAPPFSSAKDPVNMLGFTAENILEGRASFLEWNELDVLLEKEPQQGKYTVLDVTEEVERMVFQIPGSYHIPLGQLRGRLGELEKRHLIVIYCAVGVRAYNAARILMQNGFKKVKILAGGSSFYKSMHYLPGKKPEAIEIKENKGDGEVSGKSIKILDCCGLQCPGPVMKVSKAIGEMSENEVLQVSATDLGFARDIEAWCKRTNNTFLKKERREKENIVYLKKGNLDSEEEIQRPLPQGKTLVVFSGELDKVLASFIIANGAAAMGRPVTMFFTFWGLNALRKEEKVLVKKPFLDKMFSVMMPRGIKKLKLSKMNMAGMGTGMMKKVMRDKNVSSLEELMKQAVAQGIRLVACTMSMDVMGITKEEIIEGVEFAGVASYLGDAEESNVNLFI